MKSSLQTVADRINAGELAEALVESKKSNGDDDHVAKKGSGLSAVGEREIP